MSSRPHPWDVLLIIAGPERSPRRNAALARVLAFFAGFLNSVGFVAVAAYVSHMTGLTAQVADGVALGRWDVVPACLMGLAAFVAGSATCAVVFNWGRRRGLHGQYANVLLLEGLLMLLFGLLAQELVWEHRRLVIIAVLAFTMGLQNALITKISRSQIRTTHVTGMVTDLGIELGKLLYRNRLDGADPVRADRGRLALHGSLVGLFAIGGIAGALGYGRFGFPVLVPAALVLIALAARSVTQDLRRTT